MTNGAHTPPPADLALLAQIVRDVARSARLSPENAQDFSQSVHLKFLERHYLAFDRFSGRSSLRTYLTAVVKRMLLDWRRTMYGKWRPSATAVKLGPDAAGLERLVHRDGFSTSEAIEMLVTGGNAPSAERLSWIAAQLPSRQKRTSVSETALDRLGGVDFEDPVEAQERRRIARHIRQALAAAIRSLPPEDKWLLDLRYRQHQQVRAIARIIGTEPGALYRRCHRVLRELRRCLRMAGVTGSATVTH